MKKLLLLLITLVAHFVTFSENVSIPDANFKAYLVGNTSINTNNDSQIQVSEASAFNGIISCSNLSISDLTGIEAFTALTALYCHSNSLSSLDVSQNPALEVLYCGANQITNLDLSQNIALNVLYNSFNPMDSLDLSNNQALEHVFINDNTLSSLDLSQNTDLISLNCSSNFLDSLDVNQNTLLAQLIASENQLTSLDLNQNPKLELIQLNDNVISSIDLSLNTILEEIYFSNNNLSSIDVSQNPLLFNLELRNNNLTSVDLAQNPALIDLDLAYNFLFNRLDVSQNPLLKLMDCSYNQIVDIDISLNPDLLVFNCSNNQLLSLNAANGGNVNLAIPYFDCSVNPDLLCIEVDDTSYANTNFTNKDTIASYSLDCNYCLTSQDVLSISIGGMDTFVSPNANNYSATGIYTETLINSCGRDSIITINLIVRDTDSTYLGNEDFCEGTSLDYYGTNISSSGTFTHLLTNEFGCDSIVSKTFSEVILSLNIIDLNGVLEASPGLDTYQWYMNNIAIANETSNTFTPTESGAYYCEAFKSICMAISDTVEIDLNTGIHDFIFDNLSIYPNPAMDVLNIETVEEVSSICLLSLTGDEIQLVQTNARQLDVSALTAGVYFLKIKNAKKESVIKFFKK